MKKNVFQLPALWSDMFIAFGIMAVFGLLGFASHQYALQANLFGF